MFKFFIVFAISILLILFVNISPTNCKKQKCFRGKYINMSWTDSPPDYTVNMTLDDEGFMHTTTRIGKAFAKPMGYFKMSIMNELTNRETVLYNSSAALCDINAVFKKAPVLRQAFRFIAKTGNYTYKCPAIPGVYAMTTKIGSSPLMAFLYRANVSYTFEGGIFELSENKVRTNLSTYKTKIRIVKGFC